MKRCPTCQRTYADDAQKFCANDGTPLVADEPAFDPEATVMSSASKIREEASAPEPPELPPTQYFDQSPAAGSLPEQNIHQSYPQPQQQAPPPGNAPQWPPQQQQQQPYYPQSGMPGAQGAPQWQGGGQQQPQPPWMPPGQQPQGQQWGGGGFQQPGQYAPYGAQARPSGSNKPATFALICGLISFIAIAGLFIIIGARLRDLRDLIEPLGWLSLGTGLAALILGLVGIVTSKTTSSKIKAGVGMFLGILPLLLFLIGMARRF
jgi:hypothetical protein